jgi:hypothetical protein
VEPQSATTTCSKGTPSLPLRDSRDAATARRSSFVSDQFTQSEAKALTEYLKAQCRFRLLPLPSSQSIVAGAALIDRQLGEAEYIYLQNNTLRQVRTPRHADMHGVIVRCSLNCTPAWFLRRRSGSTSGLGGRNEATISELTHDLDADAQKMFPPTNALHRFVKVTLLKLVPQSVISKFVFPLLTLPNHPRYR